MSKTVEFYFDFGSPAAYLAYTQLPKIAANAGAQIAWKPFLLGGVFKATGNASPVTVPAKGKWMMGDLQRCAQRYGVPFATPPGFPLNTLALMRGAVGLQMREPGKFAPYVDTMFQAMFCEACDLADPATIAQKVAAAGVDPGAFQALIGEAEVKQALIAITEAAVARGAFGAPTYFVGEEMFFGQDRLEFVAEALRR
jgi:2-hydroxychromene-2-carboxylate isomerase